MAQSFKETAHLNTDPDKYGEGYDRIFGKKDSKKVDASTNRESSEPEEWQRIKELARKVYHDLGSGQDTEGFPEPSSFIYGFCQGYQASKEGK
jgi:hypothetical protein